MILYLSIAGAGTSDTLEQALIVAVEAETDLRYVAVVDDQQFGDVDNATRDMVAEELEFLLRAQLIAVRRRVTSCPDGHVVIHRGTAVDAMGGADDDVDEVLIGGPLALDAAAVSELIEQLGRRAGAGVRLLTG